MLGSKASWRKKTPRQPLHLHGRDLRDEVDAGCQTLLHHGPRTKESPNQSGQDPNSGDPKVLPGLAKLAPRKQPLLLHPRLLTTLTPHCSPYLAISLATFSLGQVTKAADTDPGT